MAKTVFSVSVYYWVSVCQLPSFILIFVANYTFPTNQLTAIILGYLMWIVHFLVKCLYLVYGYCDMYIITLIWSAATHNQSASLVTVSVFDNHSHKQWAEHYSKHCISSSAHQFCLMQPAHWWIRILGLALLPRIAEANQIKRCQLPEEYDNGVENGI